jgi:NAD(P)-dependent dehydrogenase (short-subunit alcohol dehydrogenase family)
VTRHPNSPLRTVVVGASSGLGRSIGTGLSSRGHSVALLARREERIKEAAAECGNGALAVRCDVTDGSSCAQAIDSVVRELGGIDALVYAAGVGPLCRLVDVDEATWRLVLDTNVMGASLVTAAAIPHLTESSGTAVYLSSISASSTPPWPGLGAYVVSKAALERLVEAWRAEHPGIGFTRLVVGECAGGEGPSMTEFSSGWDPELAVEMATIWSTRNYMSGFLLDVEELVHAVDAVTRYDAGTSVPSITVAPRQQG